MPRRLTIRSCLIRLADRLTEASLSEYNPQAEKLKADAAEVRALAETLPKREKHHRGRPAQFCYVCEQSIRGRDHYTHCAARRARVMVEVRAGAVARIATSGDVDVLTVDYDYDPAKEPTIPAKFRNLKPYPDKGDYDYSS